MADSTNNQAQAPNLYRRLQDRAQEARTRRQRFTAILQRLRSRAAFEQALRTVCAPGA